VYGHYLHFCEHVHFNLLRIPRRQPRCILGPILVGSRLRLFFIFLVDRLCKRGLQGLNKRIRARVQNGHESIAHNADNPRMDGMRTASLWGSPEPLMYLHEFLVEKSRLFSRRFYNARSDRIKDVGGALSSGSSFYRFQ
jgi:hypothetical protein